MPKFQKIPVRVGDSVKVITGSDKNKIGKVLKISPRNGKILVSGINLKFKHLKPMKENGIGEIKQIEAPIHHSNVKLNSKELQNN